MERVELNVPAPRGKPGNPAWHKGMRSANPTGRPKSIAEVVHLAREHTTEALLKLVHVMRTSKHEATVIAAANSILDRAYGKPPVAVAVAELPRGDGHIDASMSPLEAAAQWAAMIGANGARPRSPRLLEHEPQDDLERRIKAVMSNS
jgi:hypothetical protein